MFQLKTILINSLQFWLVVSTVFIFVLTLVVPQERVRSDKCSDRTAHSGAEE